MSAKLIVHKFRSGINYRSLKITVHEDDDGSNEIKYGEWSEVNRQEKSRAPVKSSRLIVKIVSGNVYSGLDLDSCARRLENGETYYSDSPEGSSRNEHKQNIMCQEINELNISAGNLPHYNNTYEGNNNIHSVYNNNNAEKIVRGDMTKMAAVPLMGFQHDVRNVTRASRLKDLSPLEYSLEKVKENNARIMENIHMLNRTLSYTKKNEILDIVCPKTMRYACNTCGKCFVYETGLKRHYSMRHSLNDIQPRWQIVWTCIECFQVWPRMDLAVKHAVQCCKDDNTEIVREIKTSSLLQCEFCEKVFTSIPRLLRHSKGHTTENNYECKSCESTFVSYKAAEQHWLLCPWLKMYYSFYLPKMLLCNACDRKFKNYEQLYAHRYKVGHFLTKTQCDSGVVKSLGLLVYQCELCSQWFSSIIGLQSHRNLHHPYYDAGLQNKMDNYKDYESNYSETGEVDCQLNQMENVHVHTNNNYM